MLYAQGNRAMKFVVVQSYKLEKIAAANSFTGGEYGVWYHNGQMVSYREEFDRDEDRYYYDYYVREDFVLGQA